MVGTEAVRRWKPWLGPALTAVVVLLIAAGVAAASGLGAAVRCTNDYSLIHPTGDVFDLRTTEGSARVDGYAPRCLVAAAVAAAVVNDQAHFYSRAPRTYEVYGARWNAGVWRCTRRFIIHRSTRTQSSDGLVTCVHIHDYGSRANTLTATVRFGYHVGA